MYCGCAIIATPNEGAGEVIVHEENGLRIDRSDADLIRERIVEYFENTELRRHCAENAKNTIRESFDWNINAKTYATFFEDILTNRLPR
jgi:glycosyltransferase involved in cell wall biosynthesis